MHPVGIQGVAVDDAALVPNPSRKNTTTLMAMMVRTMGVGLVEPTTPVRPGLVWVNAGTCRDFFAPSEIHVGHCQPTGAWTMHSVQIGRSQWAHRTEAGRSGWR